MAKSGPKPIEVTENMLRQIESIARIPGSVDSDSAAIIGVGHDWFSKKKNDPKTGIADAIKRGKAEIYKRLGQELIERALSGKSDSGSATCLAMALKRMDAERSALGVEFAEEIRESLMAIGESYPRKFNPKGKSKK